MRIVRAPGEATKRLLETCFESGDSALAEDATDVRMKVYNIKKNSMATTMRAKMAVESIQVYRSKAGVTQENIKFHAVAKKGSYPSDGSDEDNTYAKFSPSAVLEISITNPALIGKLNPGEFYYVDFSPVSDAK